MKFLGALFIGAAAGVAAIFLHHFAPPFGIAIAIAGTFVAIWSVGRSFGKRFYKLIAALSWFAIFARGASLGVGNEILIQGDRVGNVFLLTSVIALFIAIALPAN
jgi:hypothetical protein